MAKSIKNFILVSERVVLSNSNRTCKYQHNLNLRPNSRHNRQRSKSFYGSIIKKLPKQDFTITMVDFDSKLNAGYKSEYIGPHGLKERNNREDSMEIFVKKMNLSYITLS